jgi:hypothetical protein
VDGEPLFPTTTSVGSTGLLLDGEAVGDKVEYLTGRNVGESLGSLVVGEMLGLLVGDALGFWVGD